MRVLMLGWEFPPYIAGGLGTACLGLTRALSQLGVDVLFVLPRPMADTAPVKEPAAAREPAATTPPHTQPPHTQPAQRANVGETGGQTAGKSDANQPSAKIPPPARHVDFTRPVMPPAPIMPPPGYVVPALPRIEHVEFITVNVRLINPYASAVEYHTQRFTRQLPPLPSADRQHLASAPPHEAPVAASDHEAVSSFETAHGEADPAVPVTRSDEVKPMSPPAMPPAATLTATPPTDSVAPAPVYSADLYSEVKRYAEMVVTSIIDEAFDVIHAHDWMTFPAALAAAAATGKPMILHVHSTEYDRSGSMVDPRIVDIERRAMQAALRVVAVSQFTRTVIITRYGIDPARVDVVYNAAEPTATMVPVATAASSTAGYRKAEFISLPENHKVVLFMGRITHQKGPEYFLEAARKVLSIMPDVKFVMAGSGDLSRRIVDMAHELGIAGNIIFTGFLRGADVDRVFNLADCYVMPSVSEPFGLAPLEAMLHDVPVIISRQSGVAEILKHALKADFWDTTDLADKIVSVLRHPPLTASLKKHGAAEARRLSWQDSAQACLKVYSAARSALVPAVSGDSTGENGV